ncbi:MAG: hypothetical protein GY820_07395 [Gammaproteobacteria bacterium]|nr:hypothetical protein [Gammaproteobacteria bacterium]
MAQCEYVLRLYFGRGFREAEVLRSWGGQRLSGRRAPAVVRDESSRGGTVCLERL